MATITRRGVASNNDDNNDNNDSNNDNATTVSRRVCDDDDDDDDDGDDDDDDVRGRCGGAVKPIDRIGTAAAAGVYGRVNCAARRHGLTSVFTLGWGPLGDRR